MRQTKKGNQWYFGMKAHIGVDSQTKIVHSVVATPAKVHDSVCLPELLHGEELDDYGGLRRRPCRSAGFGSPWKRGGSHAGGACGVLRAPVCISRYRSKLLLLWTVTIGC